MVNMDGLLSTLRTKLRRNKDIDYLNGILIDLAVGFEGIFFEKKELYVFNIDYEQYEIKGREEIDSIANYLFNLLDNKNFDIVLKPTIIWALGKIFTYNTLENLLEYLKKIHNQNFNKAIAYQLIVSIDNFIQLRNENETVNNILEKYDYIEYFAVMAPKMDERFSELLNELQSI